MIEPARSGKFALSPGVEAVLRLLLVAYMLHFSKRWIHPEITTLLVLLNVAQLMVRDVLWLHAAGAVTFIVYFLISFPGTANHVTLGALVAAYALAFTLIRPARTGVSGRIERSFGTDLALFAGTAYFWAGFHKLNRDFFDPAVSCANWYTDKLARIWWGQAPDLWTDALRVIGPYAAITWELGAVFALLWSRTRLVAVVALFALHLYLGLGGFADFSALMAAVLVAVAAGMIQPAGALRGQWDGTLRRATAIYVMIGVLSAVAMYFAVHHYELEYEGRSRIAGLLFLGSGAMLAAVTVSFWLRAGQPGSLRAMPSRLGIVAAVVLCVWASFPYLGIGNAASLTMFSNLTTQTDRANHLLVPVRFTKVFPFEEDYVVVKDMDASLRSRFRHEVLDHGVARSHLAQRVKRMREERGSPLGATVIYQGREERIEDLDASHLARYHWYDGLMVFRPIQLAGPTACRW